MNKVLAVIIGAALGFLGLAAAVRSLVPPPFDPVEFERQQLAIEQARAIAPFQTVAAAVLALVPAALAVISLALLAVFGGAAALRFFRERRPNAAGLLPVPACRLEDVSPQALGAFHAARQLEAGRQLVPHTLTYAPHYAPHSAPRLDYRGDPGGAALPAPDEPTADGAVVPSFGQLLDTGRVGRGNPMLLGFDIDGHAVEGSWLDLYSCAVGGLSGSGKSWTATFLAAQAALFGSRIVLLDPHAADPQSLAQRLAPMRSRFVCEPASDAPQMRAAVDLVAGELAQRKAGRRGAPWLFIADEFSALQRGELADPLAALVEGLGQEGRKLGLYAMVCGQVWSAARAGGTELRDSLASAYVHRLRPAQARMLTGLTSADLPADLIELPPGTAYLLSTAGDLRRVTIPQMQPADVERVAGFLQASPGATDIPPGTPGGSLAEACTPLASKSSIRPEAARVLALFRGGQDIPSIVREVRGVEPTGGRRYQEAARDVQTLLREAMAA